MAVLKGTFRANTELFKIIHDAHINNGWEVVSHPNNSFSTIETYLESSEGRYFDVVYKAKAYNNNRHFYTRCRYAINLVNDIVFMSQVGTDYDPNNKTISNSSNWAATTFFKVSGRYHICVDSGTFFIQTIQNNIYQNHTHGLFLPLMTPNQYQCPVLCRGMSFLRKNMDDLIFSYNESSYMNGYYRDVLSNTKKGQPNNWEYSDFLGVDNIWRQYTLDVLVPDFKDIYFSRLDRVDENTNNYLQFFARFKQSELVYAKSLGIVEVMLNNPKIQTTVGAYKFIVFLYGTYNIGSTVTINGVKYEIYKGHPDNIFFGLETI